MGLDNSLNKLHNALEKLEKAAEVKVVNNGPNGSLPGQQDLFGKGGAKHLLSKDEMSALINKLDATIDQVQGLLTEEAN